MERRQAGQAARGDGDAVIGALAGDDLLLLRPAERVVEVPDQLDRQVVGLRARRGEMRLGHLARRHSHQPLGERRRRRMRLVGERMIERQLLHLRRRRRDEPRLAEADRDAPQAREPLDVLLALVVEDVDALPPLDHHRPDLLVPARVGGGMEVIGDVARGERIGQRGHRRAPALRRICARRGADVQTARAGSRKPPSANAILASGDISLVIM